MVKRRDDGGLGYPAASSYCKLVNIHSSGTDSTMIDAAAIEIDGIVCKIKKEQPDRYPVIEWFYLNGNFNGDRIASELRCSKPTIYNRLHSLHLYIQEALFDIEIEAQDRKAEQRTALLMRKYA